jgi:hypothetical protein
MTFRNAAGRRLCIDASAVEEGQRAGDRGPDRGHNGNGERMACFERFQCPRELFWTHGPGWVWTQPGPVRPDDHAEGVHA